MISKQDWKDITFCIMRSPDTTKMADDCDKLVLKRKWQRIVDKLKDCIEDENQDAFDKIIEKGFKLSEKRKK